MLPLQSTGNETRNADRHDYHFEKTISRSVLENYLARSATFGSLLHLTLEDDLRMIRETGVKFAGRTIWMWGNEARIDSLVEKGEPFARRIHKLDPDLILQGAIFEIVTKDVESDCMNVFYNGRSPILDLSGSSADESNDVDVCHACRSNAFSSSNSKTEEYDSMCKQDTIYCRQNGKIIEFGSKRIDNDLSNRIEILTLEHYVPIRFLPLIKILERPKSAIFARCVTLRSVRAASSLDTIFSSKMLGDFRSRCMLLCTRWRYKRPSTTSSKI